MASRRDYGSGSVYQRKDGIWVGTIEAGWTPAGTRRRVQVSGKTEAIAKRKLRDKRNQIERGEASVGVSEKTTVKQWVDTYLELRTKPPKALRPNALKAAASPLRRWVVPTIGHRRLSMLTPSDLRAVDEAQYAAGLKSSTADATRRALMTSLNWAVREGHSIPPRVFKVPKPGMGDSDRLDVPVQHAIAIMRIASELPHGLRWVFAAGYGERQAEALGLLEECIDFKRHVIRIEWQLQTLRYIDRLRPELGFQIPRGMTVRHLYKSWHLTPPKSKAGVRELPMTGPFEDALRAWLDVRPPNPWGLVFPNAAGLPANVLHDREEWWALQEAAQVGHPAGRWWHMHECRNLFATQLGELGASDAVATSLLGHSSILTTQNYQRANEAPKRAAIEAVFENLKIDEIVRSR